MDHCIETIALLETNFILVFVIKITLNFCFWFLFTGTERIIHSMRGKVKGQLKMENVQQKKFWKHANSSCKFLYN